MHATFSLKSHDLGPHLLHFALSRAASRDWQAYVQSLCHPDTVHSILSACNASSPRQPHEPAEAADFMLVVRAKALKGLSVLPAHA